MSDLKIIDELLLDYMREMQLMPHDMEIFSETTRDAICRLRDAWNGEEILCITETWRNYFKETS
jgi:hypothetical protein